MYWAYSLVGLLFVREAFSQNNNGWIRLPDHLQQKSMRQNEGQDLRGGPPPFVQRPSFNFQPQRLPFLPGPIERPFYGLASPQPIPPRNYPYGNPAPLFYDYEDFPPNPPINNNFGTPLLYNNYPPPQEELIPPPQTPIIMTPDPYNPSNILPQQQVPGRQQPCAKAPVPPFQEERERCRFSDFRFERFYYDPRNGRCQSYGTCSRQTFNLELNVMRNSFDSFEECSSSCYMMGTCCSLNNAIPKTDVVNADKELERNYYMCRDGTWIPKQNLCNGLSDCSEGEDESDCAPRGPIESPQNPSVTTVNSFNFTQYFMCKDGIYISKSYVCDGIRHCSSGEDERNCPGKSLVVKSLTVRNFDEMVFLRSETPFIAVYFYAPWCKACNRFRPIFKRVSKEFHGRNLTFYDVNLEQEPLLGDRFMIDTFPRVLFWNLLLQGTPMEFYKNYGLTKNGFIYWLDNVLKIKKRNDCGLLEFPCESSRECIPKGLVCDSFTQCRDGSDERLCPGNRGNKTMLLPASQINGGVNILPTGRPKTTTIRPTTPRRAVARRTTRKRTMAPRTRKTTPRTRPTTKKRMQRPTTKKRMQRPTTKKRMQRPTTKKIITTTKIRTTTRPIQTTTQPMRTTTRSIRTSTKRPVRVTPYIPTTPPTTTAFIPEDQYDYYESPDEVIDFQVTDTVFPLSPKTSTRKPCELRCHDGSCIRFRNRCNGIRECPDGADEENCASCKRTQFTCQSNKKCIDYMRRCDGDMDCEDGSDEELCEKGCKKTEFICNDGTCINFSKRCNGIYNCLDKSDEAFCPNQCNSTAEFTCNDGKCIDKTFLCDGIPHCHDSTDELSCDKSDNCDDENEWKCLSDNICINKRKRCDGYPDCHDLSDEDTDHCPKMECSDEWQFQCWDRKRCIDSRRLCDGHEDCLDRSDEIDCMNVVCQYWQYKCRTDGVCVDSRRKCDGYNDCKDGSDELDCDALSTQTYVFEHSPVTLKATPFSDAILDCNVVNPSGKWTFEGQNVQESTQAGLEGRLESNSFKNGSLLIRNVQMVDVGYYTCASSEGNEVSSVYLILDNSACNQECKDEDEDEQENNRVCGSNGVIYSSLCELKKASCKKKVKISSVPISECILSLGSKCASDERECSSPEGKCIKESSFCDGISDCEDEGDERFCRRRDMKSVIMGKNITVSIQTEMEAKTVKIKCFLSGERIIWWFNEKLISSDSAHEVREDESELIITDVRKGDAGWYSCRNMDMEEYTTYLDVEYPASALGGPAELSFLVGQRGIIPCRTDANPPISYIVWHKNGSPIGSTKGSLVLQDVTSSKDRGDYTCTPYNSRGTSGPSSKVAVRVRTRFYECPLYCSSNVYDPVCGIDGVTYENECFLILESCNNIRLKNLYAVHSGTCEKQTLPFGGISPSPASTILEILGSSTTMIPYIDSYQMETTFSPPLDIYAYPSTTPCPSTPMPLTTTPIYISWTTTRASYKPTEIPQQAIGRACKNHEWACNDGHCIPFINQCNGTPDCPSGEDEKYCADFKTDFICGDMLLDKSLVCDGYPHCVNGEDEGDCPIKEDDWTCPNSEEEYICDDYGKCACASLAPGASLPPLLQTTGFTTTPFPFNFFDGSDSDFFGSGDYQMDDS